MSTELVATGNVFWSAGCGKTMGAQAMREVKNGPSFLEMMSWYSITAFSVYAFFEVLVQ